MTFIYILIFSTAYPFTLHTEISGYLTDSSHWWHPDDINSFSKMGKLQFSQIKKLPLIFFLVSFFFFFLHLNSFNTHLVILFLEVFLHCYSGHFLQNWRWDFLSSSPFLLAIYILPSIFLGSQASSCVISVSLVPKQPAKMFLNSC